MEASISRIQRSSRGQAALLLVLLTLCVPGSATGTPAEAPAAVPTCRGVPATIVGTAEDDTLTGTAGNDVMFGGAGRDFIFGGRGADLICGGATRGNGIEFHRTQQLSGGPGDDTVVGGPGVDEIFGDGGADVLMANAGNDFMHGGANRDVLRGGPGGEELNGDDGGDLIFGGRGDDDIADFTGANRLRGGDGSDLIRSGPGNETIDGGNGRDQASYTLTIANGDFGTHCHAITVDLSQGTASGAGFGVDVIGGIENVATGGGNDVLVGDDGPNSFFTGDFCFSEPSPTETVTGNGGADLLTFNEGPFGEGVQGSVRVDLQAQTAQMRSSGVSPVLISLLSIENVSGTESRDVILGDDGRNRLSAGLFSSGDTIDGRGGADRLIGRSGNDRLDGGPGDDEIFGNRGADNLDGGTGRDRNDGGPDIDTCLSPIRGSLAISCER